MEARRRFGDSRLIRRLIVHVEHLLENKDEKLCIRSLVGTLKQMMNLETQFGDKDDSLRKNFLSVICTVTSQPPEAKVFYETMGVA
jgi:hypothetical protein